MAVSFVKTSVLLAAFVVSGGFAYAQALRASALADLTQLFAGQFDSALQYRMETSAGLAEEERHPQTYITHISINAPALGSSAFYVEEYQGGLPANVTRREIVTFDVDNDAAAIRMKRFHFKDAAAAQSAAGDVSRFGGFTADDFSHDPGCDVLWTQDDDIFNGEVSEQACIENAGSEIEQAAQYTLTLNASQFLRVDRWLYTDTGGLARGHEDDFPTVHFRVQQ